MPPYRPRQRTRPHCSAQRSVVCSTTTVSFAPLACSQMQCQGGGCLQDPCWQSVHCAYEAPLLFFWCLWIASKPASIGSISILVHVLIRTFVANSKASFGDRLPFTIAAEKSTRRYRRSSSGSQLSPQPLLNYPLPYQKLAFTTTVAVCLQRRQQNDTVPRCRSSRGPAGEETVCHHYTPPRPESRRSDALRLHSLISLELVVVICWCLT